MSTTSTMRPDPSGRTVNGGASYDLVTMIVAERLLEAESARACAHAGPSLRARLGRTVVRLGTAIGGRSIVPAAGDASPGSSLATVNRTGSAAGGC